MRSHRYVRPGPNDTFMFPPAPAGTSREEGAFGLIVVQRHLDELLQIGAADPFRIFAFQNLLTPGEIALLGDRTQYIIPTTTRITA